MTQICQLTQMEQKKSKGKETKETLSLSLSFSIFDDQNCALVTENWPEIQKKNKKKPTTNWIKKDSKFPLPYNMLML